MKSLDYWQKRSEQVAQRQFDKADAFELDQRKEYAKAMKSIQRDIEVFYQRYSINNEVTMAEARKQLTKGELKEFKMTLEEFTEKARNNVDGKWTQQLNNVYYKTRVTRLEALQTQINQQVEVLAGSRQDSTEKLLGDVYTDTYYRTIYGVQSGIGVGVPFAAIEQAGLIAVLGSSLDGRNWSRRIWDDRTKLKQELQTRLSQSFIRGDSIDRIVKDMMGRFEVSRSAAERLVQTESAFFAGQATADGYKQSGIIQQYKVLATLDNRTSSICRDMDGKVFKLPEMEVNVNYPPFHPRCRTTTVAYFDDELSVGERIARGADGKTYFVPADMTYPEWAKAHVVDATPKQIAPKKTDATKTNSISKYENAIRNQTVENAAVFDSKGKKIWESEVGGSNNVNILGAINKGSIKGNIITHNHPGIDESFSRADIKILAQEGAKEIRAVSANYTYSAKLTDSFNQMDPASRNKLFNSKVDEMFAEKINHYKGRIANKEISVDAATSALPHDLWEDFSKKTGWINYKRIKE